jgi:hypothetical protein
MWGSIGKWDLCVNRKWPQGAIEIKSFEDYHLKEKNGDLNSEVFKHVCPAEIF